MNIQLQIDLIVNYYLGKLGTIEYNKVQYRAILYTTKYHTTLQYITCRLLAFLPLTICPPKSPKYLNFFN